MRYPYAVAYKKDVSIRVTRGGIHDQDRGRATVEELT